MHSGVSKSKEKPKARKGSRVHAAWGGGCTLQDIWGGRQEQIGWWALANAAASACCKLSPIPSEREHRGPQSTVGTLGEILALCERGVQRGVCRAEGVPTRAQSGDGV